MKKLVLGLTGPTGAGKSTVAEILSKHGFAIIDADKIARSVTEKGSPALAELAAAFGSDIIDKSGELNRKLLAKRAFSDSKSSDLLNSITHPHILKLTEDKIEEYIKSGKSRIVFDAALLFESGSDSFCDFTAAVVAPTETRLKRVMRRDLITEKEAALRMSSQNPNEYYSEHADFVIVNDCKQPLDEQVNNLLDKLTEAQNAGKKE